MSAPPKSANLTGWVAASDPWNWGLGAAGDPWASRAGQGPSHCPHQEQYKLGTEHQGHRPGDRDSQAGAGHLSASGAGDQGTRVRPSPEGLKHQCRDKELSVVL